MKMNNTESPSYCYFITIDQNNNTIPTHYFEKCKEHKSIILNETLYKYIMHVKADGFPSYNIHVGIPVNKLHSKKKYNLIQVNDEIRLLYNKDIAFIESKKENLNNAIEIFNKLILTEQGEQLMFYLE